MDEVQFVSDLTYNFLKGLSDYSSPKLNKIYEEYDDEFPEQVDMEQQLERVFSQIIGTKPEAIRDTIFRRPPLLFSLCVVLNSVPRTLAPSTIASALHTMDENLNSDIPLSKRKKQDAEFFVACTASTQRIKQRRIRDSFIRKHLGL